MKQELRLAKVYDFIERFNIARGVGPTIFQIAKGCQLSVGIVRADLRTLRSRGCVTWRRCTPYTLRTIGPFRLGPAEPPRRPAGVGVGEWTPGPADHTPAC
jgi:hypothetical protein